MYRRVSNDHMEGQKCQASTKPLRDKEIKTEFLKSNFEVPYKFRITKILEFAGK